METIDFQEKFKRYLIEESGNFCNINWEKEVEIKVIHYRSKLKAVLPNGLGDYTVRMRVVKDEIPAGTDDTRTWFRDHKFIYGMMSKSVRTEAEQIHLMTEAEQIYLMTFDIGTIESIAMKTRKAFIDLRGW